MNDKAMQIAQLSGFAGLVLVLLLLILFIGADENMLWDMKTGDTIREKTISSRLTFFRTVTPSPSGAFLKRHASELNYGPYGKAHLVPLHGKRLVPLLSGGGYERLSYGINVKFKSIFDFIIASNEFREEEKIENLNFLLRLKHSEDLHFPLIVMKLHAVRIEKEIPFKEALRDIRKQWEENKDNPEWNLFPPQGAFFPSFPGESGTFAISGKPAILGT